MVIDPTLIETRDAHVEIDLTGTFTFGATVADYWNERKLGTNVKVASRVDSDRFFEMLYALLRD